MKKIIIKFGTNKYTPQKAALKIEEEFRKNDLDFDIKLIEFKVISTKNCAFAIINDVAKSINTKIAVG